MTVLRQRTRKPGWARSGSRSWMSKLHVEQLETRVVPVATITGNVFHTFNVAGLFPAANGSFLEALANVTVNLDGGAQTTTTDANGAYTFAAVAPGSHTISVVPPAGFLGFSAQTLSTTIVIGASETAFDNLNFALTGASEALVQNLYELVLQRPADEAGFNGLVALRDQGASTGALFVQLYDSYEYNTVVEPIANLVTTFFSGPTSVGLLRNAVQVQNLGISQDAAVLEILYSQPFVNAYGDTSQLTNTQFVTFLYQNILGRAPKNSELKQWVTPLINGTMNRGEVTLGVLGLPEFEQARPNVPRKVAVTTAFLGILGREPTANELSNWTRKLANGTTVRQLANQLGKKPEFANLTGFTDTFIWDVSAHQVETAVPLLDRLQIYNPATQKFDIPVVADGITSTLANPANVYFFAHGWAPGFLEAVLLESTPNNLLKSWETAGFPNPPGAVAEYLYEGTNQISAQGLAQAIVDRDPNALVVAYSWVDQSATSASTSAVQVQRAGKLVAGSPVVNKLSDTSQLTIGMPVVGPGIPNGTVIQSIDGPTQITLSANATETANPVVLSFVGVVLTGSATNASSTLTVADSSRLGAGMQVTGPGIPAGTSIAEINSPTSVTLSQSATGSFANATYLFTGEDAALQVKETAYAGQSESYTQLNGLRLAAAVKAALAPNFFVNEGLIHLLGHSHGSKVAAVAALALQRDNIPVTHLSLFESPEAGPDTTFGNIHAAGLGGAQNFLWYYLAQMELTRSPVTGRTPGSGTFVDNYYSKEGFGSALGGFSGLDSFGSGFNANLNSVVDVLFHPEDLYGSLSPSDLAGGLTTLFGSHDYPPPWYGQASLGSDYGLNWSPLLDDSIAAGLDEFYEQQQQSTPGEYVQTQFELNGSATRPGTVNYTPPAPTPLEYAQQYALGNVVDTGSTMTLSISAASPTAMNVITFNPLAAGGHAGTGMDFSFQFTGVDPGEQVELVIWIHGMASVPQALGGVGIFGNTIGYLSVPLFAMNGLDAGSAAQLATISLDGFRGASVLDGVFNSLAGGPIIPTLGFSLVASSGSSASVTITDLRQFRDGIS